MKRYVDITGKQFEASLAPEPKTDQDGKQKFSRDGQPMWVTQIYVRDEDGGEIIKVTTAGAKPELSQGQFVTPVKLEMIPWATAGKNGVAYRAETLSIAALNGKKAAA